jgi:hypothetical protein
MFRKQTEKSRINKLEVSLKRVKSCQKPINDQIKRHQICGKYTVPNWGNKLNKTSNKAKQQTEDSR